MTMCAKTDLVSSYAHSGLHEGTMTCIPLTWRDGRLSIGQVARLGTFGGELICQ